MKRSYIITFKVLATLLITFSLFLGISTAVLQTSWGREKFENTLRASLKGASTEVEFKKLSGLLPFLWEMEEVSITLQSGDVIEIDRLTFRPYLYRLLQKKVSLRSLQARGVYYYTDKKGAKTFLKKDIDLPLSFYVKKFQIQDLHLDEAVFQLTGKLKIQPQKKSIYFKTIITRNEFNNSRLLLTVKSQEQERVKVFCDLKSNDAGFLQPYYELPLNFKTRTRFHLDGSFEAFSDLALNPTRSNNTIHGHLTSHIHHIENDPFEENWYISSQIALQTDRSLVFKRMNALSKYVDFTGDITFKPGFVFDKFDVELNTHKLVQFQEFIPFTLRGDIDMGLQGQKTEGGLHLTGNYQARSLQVQDYFLKEVKGSLDANYAKNTFTGKSLLQMNFYDQNWQGDMEFTFAKNQNALIHNYHLSSPFADFSGNLEITEELNLLGQMRYRIDDINIFEVFFPHITFYGGIEGNALFFSEDLGQSVSMNTDVYDFFYKDLHVEKAHIESELHHLFEKPRGFFNTQLSRVYYQGILCENMLFNTSTEEESWPFSLISTGGWIDPFRIDARGFWRYGSNELLINMQELYGYILNHSFDMPIPTQLLMQENKIELSEFTLTMEEASLFAKAHLTEKESELKIDLTNFPLDFLSLNPLEMAIDGVVNAKVDLSQNKYTTGAIQLDFPEIEIISIADRIPLNAVGKIDLTLKKDHVIIDTHFDIREDEKITVKGALPQSMTLMPYGFKTHQNDAVDLKIVYDARAEDVLDFVNIGPHRFEADVNGNLQISGTPSRLLVKGSGTIQDGMYENYYIGTFFEEIQASISAKNDRVILKEFKGQDEEKGAFRGVAEFSLNPKKHYPYSMDFTFDDLILVDIPLVLASADGKVNIRGNKEKGTATGKIVVNRTDFSIPEKLPMSIPKLEVTYLNAPVTEDDQKIFPGKKKPYPLYLDFSVAANEQVYINGRGLSSEWRGEFDIGGTYTDIIAKGDLSLLKGDFTFAGKTFDLTHGALIFSGESNKPPYLNISGRTVESNIAITTTLKGPLTAPRITFNSTPSMPLSAILSYLIFGKDISELTVFQATQLASAAASLAGQGPDVFELARKKLGLDRFRVVHTPSSGEDEEDGTALQIGKYIMKGLLVSISQGPNPSSGNVSIEVDLTKGFIFEAQTIFQQPQGKFTLKWNYNY